MREREKIIGGVKDKNGNLITESEKVRERWKEYFDELLNVEDGREAEVVDFLRRGYAFVATVE